MKKRIPIENQIAFVEQEIKSLLRTYTALLKEFGAHRMNKMAADLTRRLHHLSAIKQSLYHKKSCDTNHE